MSRIPRRPFLRALAGAALASSQARAEEQQRERDARAWAFELTRPEITVQGLAEEHDGVVIGHLTDVHVGPSTPDARILAAVDALNEARPDVVFLTGDYVTRRGDPLERVGELLGRLRIPAVAVLGNHDHWTDARSIARHLERVGIPVLANRHTVLQVRGRPLAVVGVDDAVSGHDDVARAFSGVRPGAARLVLAHAPPTLDALPHDGGLACFSGHTHGGQIFFEGITDALFARVGQPYVRGHYRRASNQLYVSRGLGFGRGSPLPRMNADPEVALITLRRAPVSSHG